MTSVSSREEDQYQTLSVLLVDDNEDDIILIREAFEGAKLVQILSSVNDGDEALAYLRKEGFHAQAQTPALVLLDLNMPRKNGFEVLEEMKLDPALKHIPVVVLTTSKRDEDVLHSYQKGASSYLSKPADLKKLSQMTKHFELYWALTAKVPKC